MVVLLHDIRSIHNVGSILRTADGAGVEKVYLCGITPSPLNRFGEVLTDIKKTALGAEASVPWKKSESTIELIKKLRKEGYQIIALEQHKRATALFKLKPSSLDVSKIALVLGAEVEGVSKEVLAKCDTIVDIPMHGAKESLNVAVAFGIAAFHLTHD